MTLGPPPSTAPGAPPVVLPPQSTLDAAAAFIKQSIDTASVEDLTDAWRAHLGASVIGTPCERELWYAFRWIAAEKFDGRMLRLFSRGHREEDRMIAWLRRVGIHIWDRDPETGNQWRVAGHRGHFGGSLDGIAALNPAIFPGFPPHVLVECKTYATNPFVNLTKNRVRKWRPKHYAQMCTYGVKRNIPLALYIGENKNDDDFYIEFVPLDFRLGLEWEKKAARIVDAQEPPPKLSLDPAHSACKYCGASDVCHFDGAYMQNCRSCSSCSAADNGEWFCNKHGCILTAEQIGQQWACWSPLGKSQ